MLLAHKIELKPNNKQTTYFAKSCGAYLVLPIIGCCLIGKNYTKNEKNLMKPV